MSDHLFDPGSELTTESLMKLMQKSSAGPEHLQALTLLELERQISRSRARSDAINRIPLKKKGVVGRLEAITKRALKWIVHWNSGGQAGFNASIVVALEQIADNLRKISDNLVEIEARMANERANERTRDGSRQVQIGALPKSQAVQSKAMASQGFDYLLFEQKFRGSRSLIKSRFLRYVDLFLERENVLDIGCGRGEFVELLLERGVKVTGIDFAEEMVDFCSDRGLPVVLADMFEYLNELPGGSLDGAFAAQVVEHLSPCEILSLLGICAQKLKTGGLLVIETVNTNCPEALSNFYLDPTHVRPVPAELLRFMIEQKGFRIEGLLFTSPVPGRSASPILEAKSELPQEMSLYYDYDVIACRL